MPLPPPPLTALIRTGNSIFLASFKRLERENLSNQVSIMFNTILYLGSHRSNLRPQEPKQNVITKWDETARYVGLCHDPFTLTLGAHRANRRAWRADKNKILLWTIVGEFSVFWKESESGLLNESKCEKSRKREVLPRVNSFSIAILSYFDNFRRVQIALG